jgi:hypothetical protein
VERPEEARVPERFFARVFLAAPVRLSFRAPVRVLRCVFFCGMRSVKG